MSNTINKIVKFGYFQVIVSGADGEKNFDLTDWVDLMVSIALEDRGLDYIGEVIRLDSEHIHSPENEPLAMLHFTKLRGSTVPAVAVLEKPELNDVKLEANEYIAEDVSAIFDPSISVLMLQRNIYSLSVGALQEYINYFWNINREEDKKEYIELRPVFEKNSFAKGKKAEVFKKISFKTADNIASNSSNPLTGILGNTAKSLKPLDGVEIEVTVSAGRKKTKSLDSDEVKTIIKEIESNIKNFKKASVSVHETGKTTWIELIDGKLTHQLNFSIKPRTALNQNSVQSSMIEKYSRNELNGRGEVLEAIT